MCVHMFITFVIPHFLVRSPGRHCAVALDTKGPEIRTGLLASSTITVKQGQTLRLTTDESKREIGTEEELFLDYKNLCSSVTIGQVIYIADGSLTLNVVGIDPSGVYVDAIAKNSATFGSRKNVALPLCKVCVK